MLKLQSLIEIRAPFNLLIQQIQLIFALPDKFINALIRFFLLFLRLLKCLLFPDLSISITEILKSCLLLLGTQRGAFYLPCS
jgi:hypothetical protein